MITARPKPIRRIPAPIDVRPAEGSRGVGPDPADLATTLRDMTARAHRAVRALDATTGQGRPSPSTALGALRELAELHPRIVELQRSLDPVTQQGLASYLSALRREVESRLG